MSEGAGLPLADALELGRRVSAELTPLVETIKAVGSLRRKRERGGASCMSTGA